MSNLKTCSICGTTKPLSEFYDRYAHCKACYKARRKAGAKKPTPLSKEEALIHRRQANKRHYEAHKDDYLAKQRDKRNTAYATDDQYRVSEISRCHNRRALKHASGAVTHTEWLATLDKFSHTCAYCGISVDLEQDHIMPLSCGGTNTINNIVPACRHCNASKGARNVVDWYKSTSYFSEDRLRLIMRHVGGETNDGTLPQQNAIAGNAGLGLI